MANTERPSIRIRYATSQDGKLLAEIGAETFYDSFAAENTPEDMAGYLAASFSPEKQNLELATPNWRFLIAEAEGVTAGYAHLKFETAPAIIAGVLGQALPQAINAARPMEIARFYARKPWIGKGIGARLMQASLDEAHNAGCNLVWLDVWERNVGAIAFYQKWGFREVGTQLFRLGNDLQHDLLMAKLLHSR